MSNENASNIPSFVVVDDHSDRIQELATRLNLPLYHLEDFRSDSKTFYLHFENDVLFLSEHQTQLHVCVDFCSTAFRKRLFEPRSKHPLYRALGISKGVKTIADATAGFGRDSFLIASWDCKVDAIERNPIVFELLSDGLRRAKEDDKLISIANQIKLRSGDSFDILDTLAPDTIYIDPMLGETTSQAKVKKEMQVFRALLGKDHDATKVIKKAIESAQARVVVKRPLRSEALHDPVSAEYTSKRTRYDMYLV